MNLYGNYKKSRNAAWQVLIDFQISALPVHVSDIAKKADIRIVKNSNTHLLNSDELAVSILDNGRWYIVFDDTLSAERARYTIAHELGHIFLGHPLDRYARTISKEKPADETAADMFAARLLAPACVLWGLNVQSADEIRQLCEISKQAAEIRMERMKLLYERNKFLLSPLERQVYEQFQSFINERRETL